MEYREKIYIIQTPKIKFVAKLFRILISVGKNVKRQDDNSDTNLPEETGEIHANGQRMVQGRQKQTDSLDYGEAECKAPEIHELLWCHREL